MFKIFNKKEEVYKINREPKPTDFQIAIERLNYMMSDEYSYNYFKTMKIEFIKHYNKYHYIGDVELCKLTLIGEVVTTEENGKLVFRFKKDAIKEIL